jgi:hypothetical protein
LGIRFLIFVDWCIVSDAADEYSPASAGVSDSEDPADKDGMLLVSFNSFCVLVPGIVDFITARIEVAQDTDLPDSAMELGCFDSTEDSARSQDEDHPPSKAGLHNADSVAHPQNLHLRLSHPILSGRYLRSRPSRRTSNFLSLPTLEYHHLRAAWAHYYLLRILVV